MYVSPDHRIKQLDELSKSFFELEQAYHGLQGALTTTEPLRIVAAASHLSKPYEDLRELVSDILLRQLLP